MTRAAQGFLKHHMRVELPQTSPGRAPAPQGSSLHTCRDATLQPAGGMHFGLLVLLLHATLPAPRNGSRLVVPGSHRCPA